MPNWCSTAYVIEGDAQEIKSLYELMKDLQDRKTPAVKNGFGTSWLGCLVDALGKDPAVYPFFFHRNAGR